MTAGIGRRSIPASLRVPTDHAMQARTPTPPKTLDQLRELALKFARAEPGDALGGKTQQVFARLVDMPEQSAVRSISELAALLDVNPSTLTRLAKRLGFEGFGEFQSVFRNAIAGEPRYFYSRQADQLLHHADAEASEIETMARLGRESIANIEGFIGQLEADRLAAAAGLLAKAKRVRVHGERQFHGFASFLAYGLGMLRSDAALLDAPRLGLAEAISQLEPGDVVVVASCAPYTRSVADVAKAAARNGQRVIAITDSRSSPLVAPAEHAFFIPHASSFISNSMGAYIVFCEGLLNLVAWQLGDAALEALQRRENLIEALGIETP